MPVHRIPGGKGGAVFADRAEIDAWLVQPKVAADVGALPPHIDAIQGTENRPNVQAHDGVSSRSPVGASTVRRLAPIAIGLIVLAGVAATVIRIQTAGTVVPATFEFKAGTLIAHAPDDAVLWTFQLPEQPGSVVDGAVVGTVGLIGTARANLHGHHPDALALVSMSRVADSLNAESPLRSEVYCLSSNGRLRWMFYPRNRLTFAGREFAGPWRIWAWTVLPGSKPHLWVSSSDNVWWPTVIVSLDAAGKAETVFVNSGHIAALAPAQFGGARYVLAGGVNNEYRSAMLAMLDSEGEPSSSPQTAGTPFACDQCPGGLPHRYFLFPRMEVAAAASVPYEYANLINATPGAPIEVSVRDMTALNVRAVYRFSEGLMPESVAMSDRYWEIHREMSRNGTLDHPPEDCPERNDGVIVRMWQPGTGWSNIKVLPTFAPRETH